MSDLVDNHINTRSLQAELTAKRDSGRKLLLPYVTAGIVPNWMDCVEAVIEAGADAVEIGIPFSDPAMDGPTIQQASVQALNNGITPHGALSELRTREFAVPLIAMTYFNLVFRYVSSDERLAQLVERTSGFIYTVSTMGTTGERAELDNAASILSQRVKAISDLPVIIGFGISNPEHAVSAARSSDGVIVASALMRTLLDGGSIDQVASQVSAMRVALDEAF
jgi:tryptophan synthase alpha chain